ncbi:hypothetical protein [Parapedobacter sp. DT-150]|uniref:hypothetical protein n=1 Tax=Parapedobacter sp. DT-150 TaxID=3396162 RepID=UPI003F54112A
MSALSQITVNLPQANITARSDYTASLASGTYTSVVSLLPTIQVKANTANFANTAGGTTTVPLNMMHIRIRSIGSLSLLGSSTEVMLSTTYGTLYTALASISSGAVTADYRVTTGSHTWVAGVYSTPIQFRTGTLSPNQITPTTPNLVINVPGFIAPQTTLPAFNLAVNSLGLYRAATGVSTTGSVTVSTTVPYLLNLNAGSAQFSFTTSTAYNQLPATAVSLVNGTLSNVAGANVISLSTTSQSLTPATGIAVPTGNNQTLNAALSITGPNLRAGFLQAGTYSVPITYTWSKLASAYPTGTLQATRAGTLQVVVSDMAELVANQQTVALGFATTDDYRQGITVDMAQHLRLSRTTPYSVYARSASENFSAPNGEVPVGILRIGPVPGQSGVNTVTLSTTPQLLIDNANPTVDRTLSLRYSIPPAETARLLGKAAGTYSAQVIYSFTAL